MKFRDHEILTAYDLASSIHEMKIQNRFHHCFVMVDTCQAATLVELVHTPGVITLASSGRGENSYSHGSDSHLGLSQVDKFTYYFQQFYSRTGLNGSMYDLLTSFSPSLLHSSYVYRTELFDGDVKKTPIRDFLGATPSQVISDLPITYEDIDWPVNSISQPNTDGTLPQPSIGSPLLTTSSISMGQITSMIQKNIHGSFIVLNSFISIWSAVYTSIVILLLAVIAQ